MISSLSEGQREKLSNNIQPGSRPYLATRYDNIVGRSFKHIKIRLLSGVIGAEVSGIDLSCPLSDDVLNELVAARLLYRVLFFRGQSITAEQQKAFALRFGDIEEHPFLKNKKGHADVITLEKSETDVGVENTWHSDVSWREIPSLGSVLCAKEVPEVGGDTLFSDTIAAYECLDEDLKERLLGLEAVHDFTLSFGLMMGESELAEMQKQYPAVTHPVIRLIPETGEKGIYVNRIFTSHIVGLDKSASDALLELLFSQMETPEFQYRFQWRKDSVAFWDNRMLQHYAVNDYWPRRRVMERVTIIGERPV